MYAGRVADHKAHEPVARRLSRGLGLPRVGLWPHVRQANFLALQAGDQVTNLRKQFNKRSNIEVCAL